MWGRPLGLPLVAAALAIASAACVSQSTEQTARASEDWVRSYPLATGGEFQILNLNGNVELDTAPGTTIEVRAERVAHATTEQAARDLLTHVAIGDTATPARVALETQRIPGVLIGAGFEVHYHVKLPASASVRIRTANGSIHANGIAGRVSLTTTNGSVVARALAGSIEVRATNGSVDVEARMGTAEFIDVRAVNGHVDLAVPNTLNANVSATTVNGHAQVTDVKFESLGDVARDPRRLRGRINSGGMPIELSATNGSIRVRGYE
jgi:hypothetical protein